MEEKSSGHVQQLPPKYHGQRQGIKDKNVIPPAAKLGGLDGRHIQCGQQHKQDIEKYGENRLTYLTVEEKDTGQNKNIIVQRQSHVGRLINQAEDIEIAKSEYPGRYDNKGSRQEPGAEMSVA